jgi:tetratricopeptide (TPR) repeat protein
MKQVLLTVGLCFAITVAFAQKAAVSGAEKIAKDQKGNISEARNLIKGAMTNPETKDDPKTWFVAGQVEDAQFNRESTKQILGQKPNEPIMYEALANTLPFLLKAYELDQLPNDKGKIAPKYVKNIKGIIAANHVYFLNGGGYYLDERDYQKAYDFFEQYIQISNLPFFAGEKTAAKDENFNMVQFFAGAVATYMDNPELAIKALTRAKDTNYRQYDVYQNLTFVYEQAKDSVNLEKTLEEGMRLFSDSSFFILNLINNYIYSERNDKAIDLLTTAIAKNPANPQLYSAMGNVYESGYKDNDKAEVNYKKFLELEPESPHANYFLGRVYYNAAIAVINEANALNDVQQYNTEKEKAKALFQKARPFFEKAHQLDPKNSENMMALRGIYYQLGMEKEYNEMEAKMENR